MKYLFCILIASVAVATGCKKDKKMGLAVLSTSSASNITSTSAQLGGNITDNGGSSITMRGICWATHSVPTVSDSITSDGSGSGAFTSSLNALFANTTYYVRAYAINSSGTAYGNEVSFVTAKGLATITTTAITNISQQTASAMSGGNIISDGGAAITARGICWSTTAHPTITNLKTSDSIGTGTFTSTLSPLVSQSTYYVRAYATNSFGTAYGNELSFTTGSLNSVVDIDGNVYPYVVIGNQTWMASNLRTSHFNNGDPITNGLSGFDWYANSLGGGTIPAYTFPNGDSSTNNAYGKLYNTNAINDNRNACPLEWHVSTSDDWDTLLVNQGMTQSDIDNWNPGNIAAKLLEGGSSGLNLQEAGHLDILDVNTWQYNYFQQWGSYLTTTIMFGYNNYLVFNGPAGPNGIYFGRSNHVAFAVRCVKD